MLALEAGDITAQEFEIIQQTTINAIAEDNPHWTRKHGKFSPAGSHSGKKGRILEVFSAGADYLNSLRSIGAVPSGSLQPSRVCQMSFAFALGALNWVQQLDCSQHDSLGAAGAEKANKRSSDFSTAAANPTNNNNNNDTNTQAQPSSSDRASREDRRAALQTAYEDGQRRAVQCRGAVADLAENRGFEASKRAVRQRASIRLCAFIFVL